MTRLDPAACSPAIGALDPDETIRTIPVVMLTALSDEVDQVRGAIEGAVRYLAKPVTFLALVKLMKVFTAYWLETAVLPPEDPA